MKPYHHRPTAIIIRRLSVANSFVVVVVVALSSSLSS